jgi:hypothetical protein
MLTNRHDPEQDTPWGIIARTRMMGQPFFMLCEIAARDSEIRRGALDVEAMVTWVEWYGEELRLTAVDVGEWETDTAAELEPVCAFLEGIDSDGDPEVAGHVKTLRRLIARLLQHPVSPDAADA